MALQMHYGHGLNLSPALAGRRICPDGRQAVGAFLNFSRRQISAADPKAVGL